MMKLIINNYTAILKKNSELSENREIIIIFFRFSTYSFNLFFLLFILDMNIFLSIFLCHWLNLIFWDIITTWYIFDYVRGKFNKKENKYIKSKIYLHMISLIDFIFWLKEYIVEKKNYWWKNRKKLKKKKNLYAITFNAILYITAKLINTTTYFYNKFIWLIYSKNNVKEYDLNLFWHKINSVKKDLENKNIAEVKIGKTIESVIKSNISLNRLYDLKFKFLKNDLMDIWGDILWNLKLNILKTGKNKKNIILFLTKLLEITLFIIKFDIKFIKNSYNYIHIYIKKYIYILLYRYIYNINVYIFIYNIYIYIFIIIYNYYIYIYNIIINTLKIKIKENKQFNNYLNNYIYIYILNWSLQFKNKFINKRLINKYEKYKKTCINHKLDNNELIKNIRQYFKKLVITLINNSILYINNSIVEIIFFVKKIKNNIHNTQNKINSINWKKIILEIKIYYVNKKRPWKQFKYDNSIYIIKYLDGLEYAMLTHKKLYIGRNISKYHKKKYIVKKIPSVLEKEIKIGKSNLNKYLEHKYTYYITKYNNYMQYIKLINVNYKYNKYLYNLIIYDFIAIIINNLIKNILPFYLNMLIQHSENIFTINLYKLYNIYIINKEIKQTHTSMDFKKIIYKINSITNNLKNYTTVNKNKSKTSKPIKYYINTIKKNINLNKLNIIVYACYLPLIAINWFMSDVALSITFFINKKLKKINKKLKKIIKITNFIKSKLKLIYFYTKKVANFLFCKTIYITFLIAYFYNKKTTIYLNEQFIKKRYFYYLENDFLNYIIINKNILLTLLTVGGLLLTIKWSRGVHRFFGNYLWTMMVFPLFLESHKIWYFKFILTDFLKYKTPENMILFKLNILEKFNYNIYNMYYFLYVIVLYWFLYYTIKHGAFRTAYANLRAPRWFFIKYPIIFLIIESSRLYFIKIISSFIIYYNLINDTHINIFNIYIWFNDLFIIKIMSWFFNRFLINTYEFPHYIIYLINIPNLYLLNFIFDVFLIYFSLKWLVKYCKTYLKKDKYVAFPLVMFELALKYCIYFYFIFYFTINFYDIGTEPSGKIFEYIALTLTLTYLYLEIRVHKVPRKTMPWYFRQIVELWPTTSLNMWTTARALYSDQQKYLSMRQKFRHYKEAYKIQYNSVEVWEKKIFLAYQRDKEINLYNFSAFCRLMYRKEGMLREFNIYDYHGWQQDWTWFYKNIRIYHWKLDWWDKPHIYLFNKYISLKNVAKYYVNVLPFAYRFSTRYTFLTIHFFIVKLVDLYYGYKFIICDENIYRKWIYKGDKKEDEDEVVDEFDNIKHKFFFRGRKHWKLCVKWRKKHKKESDYVRRLRSLKRLKKILMEFSSGERLKTPDWAFPLDFEKQYKKEGWKMFENLEIDNVVLDWRPIFKEW